MRFATRAFVFCVVPFALVLAISFLMLQSIVQLSARDQLRVGVRDKQLSVATRQVNSELRFERLHGFAGESGALKAGLQQLASHPGNTQARRAIQDQLEELSYQTGFKLLVAADSKSLPVAWIVSDTDSMEMPDTAPPVAQGLAQFRGNLYRFASIRVLKDGQTVGYVTAGEPFDLAEFGVPVVLFQNGRIVRTSNIEQSPARIGAALAACADRSECDIKLNGANYLSLQLNDVALGPDYVLRSLQNVDYSAAPVQTGLKKVFLMASLGAILAALAFGAGASRFMVRPLTHMLNHLQNSEAAGSLMELPIEYSRITEVGDLIRTFNRAAVSVRDARHGLHTAYVEFGGSLANALDARDRYTAGHSQRVSQLAVAIAQEMNLDAQEQERVRIGGLLHDIGKIGIPDSVLQKPGSLSDAEFALIQQHPTIGRRILQCVNGFSPYLPVVEFHHENWDGSGYPRGLRGEDIPVAARIVHVADAWDAMTTDRPYRRGLGTARALSLLRANSGKQFDPEIAEILRRMMVKQPVQEHQSMLHLAVAVGQRPPVTIDEPADFEHS